MSNPLTKYICTNAACESYYDSTLIEFSQDEVIPGATSETCCPKCGFVLTPLDYYLDEKKKEKKEKWKRLIKIIAIGVIGIILIAFTILMITGKKNSEQKRQESSTKIQPKVPAKFEPKKVVIDSLPILTHEADLIFSNKEYIKAKQKYQNILVKYPGNEHAKNQLIIVEKKLQPPPQPPLSTDEKNFQNGDRYVGEMKNGKMNGLGTYYYNSEQIISERDLKDPKRKALKGDYLIGEWFEGKVVQGRLYDSNNHQKEVIIIGR
jgi:hypothetical protein